MHIVTKVIRKTFYSIVFIILTLTIATPVLADYLGPDRTVTETISVCKIVLYEYGYVPSKGDYRFHRVDDWSCSNEGKPWLAYPSDPSSLPTVGEQYWQKEEVLQEVTTTHPPATISSSLTNCTLNNGWCTTSPMLSLNGNEPLSGFSILAIEGSLNGQTFACSSSTCDLPLNEGDNNFTFWALSSWGDSSSMGTFSAKVDTVAPNAGLNVSGSNGTGNWYVSPTTVTATGSDSTSGLSSALLSVNGGAWTASTTLNDGMYTVDVRAEDNAGNISTSSTTISVDTTTPSIDVSVSGTIGSNPSTMIGTSGWYSSNVQVTATVTDAISGIASFEISTDGGAYQAYTYPISFTDGQHTIQFKATDNAGNQTETPVQEFYVDTVAPTIDIPASWEVGMTIDYNIQDIGSGLSSLRIVIEDEDEKYAKVAWDEVVSGSSFDGEITWDGKFADGTVAPPGEYLVWIKAKDKAGNERFKYGRIIVPEPNVVFSLFQSTTTNLEPPLPPQELFDEDNLSITNSSVTTTTQNSGYGGSTTETKEITQNTLSLASGTASASTTTSSSNIVWGSTAVAAMVGAAMGYALDEKRKRKEEEAQQRAQVQAEVDATNAALEAQRQARREEAKIQSWLQSQAILNAYIEEAERQGASDAEIAELRQTGATKGLGVAIEDANTVVQTHYAQNVARQQAMHAHLIREYDTAAVDAWRQRQAELKKQAEEELQAGLAAYYNGMRQGEQEAQTNWWDATKNFVQENIVQPLDTYIYQPIIMPIVETITEIVVTSTTWVNENVYQPYIKPEIDREVEKLTSGISWVNENFYQPYIKPEIDRGIEKLTADISWVNESFYQPYIKPEIDRSIEQLTASISWVNEHLYQPYIKPEIDRSMEKFTAGISWMNENLYQPYIKPEVDKVIKPVTTGIMWVNQNIYQPIFQPVISDINKYIYQPLADKAEKAWDKYGEWVHGSLDAAGLIPGFGEIADGLNGLIYLSEGRYLEAGISAMAMIPILGDLGKAGKWTVKIGSEIVEVVAETTIKTALKEIAENAAQEAVEKVVKESLEEGLEKAAKEALENAAENAAENALEKSAKEAAQVALAATIKESGEQIQISVVNEVTEKSIKEFVNGSKARQVAKDAAEERVAEEIAEQVLEHVDDETAKLIKSLKEIYGEETVARFLPFCEKYGINPSEVLTRPPAEGQSLIGWGLDIENPANPANHPLVNLNLTQADLDNILKQSTQRPDSKTVVLGYGGGCAKPYYALSDEIGGCHLSLSAETWAPFDKARANFWTDINAPFLEKAVEDRKIFLFNVGEKVVTNPRNIERFSLPELRLIELETNNYVNVPVGDYTAFIPIELIDTYEQYLPAGLFR